jgi:Zn-dependent protease
MFWYLALCNLLPAFRADGAGHHLRDVIHHSGDSGAG